MAREHRQNAIQCLIETWSDIILELSDITLDVFKVISQLN